MRWFRHPRGEFTRFEIPTALTVQQHFGDGSLAYIALRDDVDEWCKAGKVRYRRLRPKAIFGKMMLGPTSITMRENDAVMFKLTWF